MSQHEAAMETEILSDHLALVAHCARNATPDGMPRAPGFLLVSTNGEAWVVEVIDPDTHRSIRCIGLKLDDTLILADTLVRSKSPPWATTPASRAKL